MSHYNKKVVRTSSYIEIWEYDKPIYSNKHITADNDQLKQVSETKKRRSFNDLTPEEQSKRIARMKKIRLDAKHELVRLIDTNFDERTSFLTLTTKANVTNREDFKKLLKAFIKRLNYHIYNTKKSKIKYISVLEKQKRGAWHAHTLLFSIPYIPHQKLLKIWGHGAVRINKVDVDSAENRGRYITKYFDKGIGQELIENFGKQSFLCSRNLKKPSMFKFYDINNNNFDGLTTIYENEYFSKSYKDGKLVNNKVKYKKIKLTGGKNDG